MISEGAFGICLFIIFFGGIAAFIIRISSGIFKLTGSLDSSIQMLQVELDSMGHCFKEPFQQLKNFEILMNAMKRAFKLQVAIFIHILAPYAIGIIFVVGFVFLEIAKGSAVAINNYSLKKYLQEAGEMAFRFG